MKVPVKVRAGDEGHHGILFAGRLAFDAGSAI